MTSPSNRTVRSVPMQLGATVGAVVPESATSYACGVAVEMRDTALVGPVFPHPCGAVSAETMQGILAMLMRDKGYDLDRDGVRMFIYDVRRVPNATTCFVVIDILPLEDESGGALTEPAAEGETQTHVVMIALPGRPIDGMAPDCVAGREAIVALRDAARHQTRH